MQNTNPDLFAQAFGKANLQDVRDADAILAYGRNSRCNITETTAAAIRFGLMQGKRESKEKIRELHQRIHRMETTGGLDNLTDVRRTIKLMEHWIEDPDTLREVLAFMEGRAAMLDGSAPDAQDEAQDDEPAADQRGDTENDVNTPTEKREV